MPSLHQAPKLAGIASVFLTTEPASQIGMLAFVLQAGDAIGSGDCADGIAEVRGVELLGVPGTTTKRKPGIGETSEPAYRATAYRSFASSSTGRTEFDRQV